MAISGYKYQSQQSLEAEFSSEFSEISGCTYNIPCASGSSALALALEAQGVGLGDEVIVPAFTWIAPVAEILRVNATPILVDIEPSSLCLDVERAIKAITPATKAIIAVHLYGNTGRISQLVDFCKSNGIVLIEDCAQAHGGVHGLGNLGSLGDCSIYSFQQSKQITSGEGGAVCTNNHEVARRVQALKNNGRRLIPERSATNDVELFDVGGCVGTNAGLTEFQIAMLLDSLEEFQSRRSNVRESMEDFISRRSSECINFPQTNEMVETHRYCLPIIFSNYRQKDMFLNATRSVGFGTFFVGSMNEPVNESPKFEPWAESRFKFFWHHKSSWVNAKFENAAAAYERGVFIHHSVFLEQGNIGLISNCLDRSTG